MTINPDTLLAHGHLCSRRKPLCYARTRAVGEEDHGNTGAVAMMFTFVTGAVLGLIACSGIGF